MEEKISNLKLQADEMLDRIETSKDVEKMQIEYLGKKGIVVSLLKGLKDVAVEDRKKIGEMANNLRDYIEKSLEAKKEEVKEKEYEEKIKNAKKIDLSVPVNDNLGSLHPITIVQKELENIFSSMGFTIEDGNEVETEYNNFEAVNVPKYHPARDMQDTFWLENGQLLKTQTSAAQNKIMKKY